MRPTYILPLVFLLFSSCATSSNEPQPDDVESLHPPQFTLPPDGVSVNERFTVVLQCKQSRPCVSIPSQMGHATLMISRRLLERLVVSGKEEPWTWQNGYRKDSLGERASGILQAMSEGTDQYGCRTLARRQPFDSDYLLGALLTTGQLAVVRDKTGEFLPSLTITYSATASLGGDVRFGDILRYETWVH